MIQYLFPLLQVHIGFVLGQSSLASVSTTSDGNEKLDNIYLSILLRSPKTNKFVLNWTLFVHVTHPAEIWTQKNWTLAITRHSGWTLGRNSTVQRFQSWMTYVRYFSRTSFPFWETQIVTKRSVLIMWQRNSKKGNDVFLHRKKYSHVCHSTLKALLIKPKSTWLVAGNSRRL